MGTTQVLVAGVGNIFLGDDGFGPAVVRQLSSGGANGVHFVDYGIRGMHLAYDLLNEWDALVLVDAIPDRGAPGRIEVFRIELAEGASTHFDGHAMNPEAVFETVLALGGTVPPTIVVGCQVESVAEGIGLTASVEAAVPHAITAIDTVVADLLDRQEV
ncbi:hydrogenase maturation protease [Nocardia sp. NPDC004278]